MGVPGFAAWLTKKFPSMVMNSCPSNVHSLYIDLNGLIHPCCHDEFDRSVALRTQEEKLRSICLAVETLVVTVQPQQVIYIAIDGVAPQAKMKQQRARRYMSAAVPLTDTVKPIHGGDPATGARVVAAMEKESTTLERSEAERELEDVRQALQTDVLYGVAASKTREGEGTQDTVTETPSPNGSSSPMPISSISGQGLRGEFMSPSVSSPLLPRTSLGAAAPSKGAFDSNCISPGTAFMDAVAAAIRDFLRRKLSPEERAAQAAIDEDGELRGLPAPAPVPSAKSPWTNCVVIFSDSNTAGEGEHKLVDFLRTQSAFPGFNSGGCHVIAGLDADLIFLSLSLHIPRVVILRDNNRSSYAQALLPDTAGGSVPSTKLDSALSPVQKVTCDGLLAAARSSTSSNEDTGISAAQREEGWDSVATALGGPTPEDAPYTDTRSIRGDTVSSTHTPASPSPASPAMDVSTTVAELPLAPLPTHIAAMVVPSNNSYTYLDIDVVGGSVVSEVYQLCREKNMQTQGDPLADEANCVTANGFRFHCTPAAEDAGSDANDVDVAEGDAMQAMRQGRVAERNTHRQRAKTKRHYPTVGRTPASPPSSRPPFHPCTSLGNSKVIDDFIVLGMLLGNDFLPHLPSVYCEESAMDTLLDVYVSAVLPHGYLTGGHHSIQLVQLERLLRAYAAVEVARFRQFAIQSGTMTLQEAATLALDTPLDRRCWRDSYIRSTSLRNETGVEAACRSYVEGLRFVWRYYSSVSVQVSWSWFYPFHHAPLALDVADFLLAQGPHVQRDLAAPLLERRPPSPFCQLLSILPPRSHRLLPVALHECMLHPSADLTETFPRCWAVDKAGAYGKEHLAAVLLPFADMQRLKSVVAAATGTFTAEEIHRDTLRSSHLVLQSMHLSVERSSESSTPVITTATSTDQVAAPLSAPLQSLNVSTTWHGFRIQGGGLSPCSKEDVPVEMQGFATVACSSLIDVVPPLLRPRTYSFTVPIPNMTVLPDGARVAEERSSHQGRGGARSRRSKGWSDRTAGQKREENAELGLPAAAAKATAAEQAKPPMLFGEFVFCLMGIMVTGASVTLWRCAPTLSFLQIISTVLQLSGIGVMVLVLAFLLGLAVAPQGRSSGSGLHRHKIFTAFVDWLCAECLSVNFLRNRRCFICRAPFDPARCLAMFSRRSAAEPPLMDPDHSTYVAWYGIAGV